MRKDTPSFTARAVALFRAVASGPGAPYTGVSDPVAPALLPAPFALLARMAGRAPRLAPALARVLTAGLLDHVALRTAAIDDAARAALAAAGGAAQLVILGAGLDARAWRMDELASARVYEVDFPATQRLKRARLADRAPRAREVRFVAVDFARDDLAARLADAGHDTAAPTVWIWEGVTAYLPRAALRATLAVVAARSAPGSTLLVTYSTPDLVRAPPWLLGPIKLGFGVLGEPLVGAIATDELAALLREAGFELARDSGPPDWARAYLAPGRSLVVEITERLAVATKREAAA